MSSAQLHPQDQGTVQAEEVDVEKKEAVCQTYSGAEERACER